MLGRAKNIGRDINIPVPAKHPALSIFLPNAPWRLPNTQCLAKIQMYTNLYTDEYIQTHTTVIHSHSGSHPPVPHRAHQDHPQDHPNLPLFLLLPLSCPADTIAVESVLPWIKIGLHRPLHLQLWVLRSLLRSGVIPTGWRSILMMRSYSASPPQAAQSPLSTFAPMHMLCTIQYPNLVLSMSK